MSLFSKIGKAVTKASKVLPAVAGLFPNSKTLAGAAQAFQTGASIAQMGGAKLPPVPGVAGPITFPQSAGAMPVSMTAGMLPPLPTPGGGIVKTSFPLLAAAAAPAIVAGGRALVQRGAAAIAARGGLAVVAKKVANALGWVTVGGLVYDAAGQLMGRASRRQMNPLNQRAARRAIRRIKRVRKIVQSIERALPKSKSRRC